MELQTRNASLEDLAKLLQAQQAAKLDAVVPASRIHSVNGAWRVDDLGEPEITEDGVTTASGMFVPTDIADAHVADKLSIPLAYLRKMRSTRPDLYDANVNGWLHGVRNDEVNGGLRECGTCGARPGQAHDPTCGATPADPRSFLLRTFRGEPGEPGIARALLSDRYGIMDNFDSLVAVLEGVRQAGVRVSVDGCDLSEHRMRVRVACPDVKALAPTLLAAYRSPWGQGVERVRQVADAEGMGYGDGGEPVIFAGFEFGNSETGGGAWSIAPRLVVQVCRNGLRWDVAKDRRVHVGGRLAEGVVQWSAETEARQLAVMTSKATDSVRYFLSQEFVDDVVDQLEAKAGAELAEPAKAVEVVTKRLRTSDAEAATILDHFIRGGQTTVGGILGAFTSAAQTVADPDRAAELEELGIEAFNLAAAELVVR